MALSFEFDITMPLTVIKDLGGGDCRRQERDSVRDKNRNLVRKIPLYSV